MLIALNARTGDAAWQGSNRRLFERAVTVAASVAAHAERQGYTFGLVSNAVASYSSKWILVPSGSGQPQLEATLESLAMAGPFWVAELPVVLGAEARRLPAGSTVVLVTAILSRAVVQEADEIRRRGPPPRHILCRRRRSRPGRRRSARRGLGLSRRFQPRRSGRCLARRLGQRRSRRRLATVPRENAGTGGNRWVDSPAPR